MYFLFCHRIASSALRMLLICYLGNMRKLTLKLSQDSLYFNFSSYILKKVRCINENLNNLVFNLPSEKSSI